ncbi:MAG: hypothetical protein JXA53_06600 [Bacteroidales bacterium]|nr:hypothetical protein [Bacteroidales bacterium]
MDKTELQPEYIIKYNDTDVTKDFSPLLTSVVFKDFLESRAGELELTFADTDGRFLDDWYPKTADNLNAQLGYVGNPLMDCGLFFVYEVVNSGSRSEGNVCSIRSASVNNISINKPIKKTHHKSVPLKTIANDIAGELGFTLKGETDGTFSGEQKQRDLSFLAFAANQCGKVFKIEGNDIILYSIDSIKSVSYSLEIDLNNVIDYSFSDKSDGKYNKCTCKWYDQKTKMLFTATATLNNDGGEAVIWKEVDSNSEAQKQAENWLKEQSKQELELELTLVGDVRCRAGIKVNLINAGRFSAHYYIKESTHEQSRSAGYTTKITLAK